MIDDVAREIRTEYFRELRQRLPAPLRVSVPARTGLLSGSFEMYEQGKTLWIANRARYAPYVRYKNRIDEQSRVVGTMRRQWERVHREAAETATKKVAEQYVEHLAEQFRQLPGVTVTTIT